MFSLQLVLNVLNVIIVFLKENSILLSLELILSLNDFNLLLQI